MKKIISILTGCLLTCLVMAGGVDMASPIVVSDITTITGYTNGASDATSDPLWGYVEGIHIEVSGVTTMDVDIVAMSAGPDRQIFSIDDSTSTNAYYPVRLPLVSTAGVAIPNTATSGVARIPLVGNPVKVMAYSAGITNKSITVRLYLDN